MNFDFSIIVPVYNRPDEVRELLESLTLQDYTESFEIVLVEDGSDESSEDVAKQFSNLNISYYFKPNTGPGDSRNYGMNRAKGNYFIIFDSDCVIPLHYLKEVANSLEKDYCDFFGGPDAARENFTTLQKAINYSMTSWLTTGGIRGKETKAGRFEPRSFNMGISKQAFEASGGFGRIHPGEDPDLSIRLWKLGFKSRLFPNAFVYHKRRISWSKFYTQVRKFGLVRPILTSWHPTSAKITFWFPSFFSLGILLSIICALFGFRIPLYMALGYMLILFTEAIYRNNSLKVGFYAVVAVLVQFFGYGIAFLESVITIRLLKKDARQSFPHLFFD